MARNAATEGRRGRAGRRDRPRQVCPSDERTVSRGAAAVFVSSCLLLLSLFAMRCTLSLYVRSLGGGPSQAGMYMGALTISSVIVRPLAGHLIDMYGTAPFLLIAGIMAVLTPLAHLVVHSLSGAGIVAASVGMAHGLVMTASVSLFLSLATERNSSRMVNLSGLTVVGTTAIAPVVALSVLEDGGGRTLYPLLALVGFAGLLASLWTLAILPRTETGGSYARSDFGWRILASSAFLTASLPYLAWAVTYGVLLSFLPLYGSDRGIENVGVFFTAYAVVNFAIRSQVPRLMERIGQRPLVVFAFTMVTAAVLSLVWFHAPRDLVISGTLYGLGSAAVYTPLAWQVVEHVPKDHRTRAMSLFMLNIEVGESLGAAVLGMTSRLLTYPKMFGLASIVPLIGLAVFLSPSLLRPPTGGSPGPRVSGNGAASMNG